MKTIVLAVLTTRIGMRSCQLGFQITEHITYDHNLNLKIETFNIRHLINKKSH